MATENIRKESFRRPNILRKRAMNKTESRKDIEAGVGGAEVAPQLTIVISSKACQKRMTHLSQTSDETFQRCAAPTTGHDDMLLDLHSRLFEDIEHNEMSMSELNYSCTASNNAGNICVPSLPLSSKDNNSILDEMSSLQETWMHSGGSQEVDRLHLSLPLRQVESLDTDLQQGKGRLSCPWPGCVLAFAHACRLREHWRSHSGARPYACARPGCRAAFRSASKRRRHETRVAHPQVEAQAYAETQAQAGPQAYAQAEAQASAPPRPDPLPPARVADPVLSQPRRRYSLPEEGGSARTHRPWSGRAGLEPSPERSLSALSLRSADVWD